MQPGLLESSDTFDDAEIDEQERDLRDLDAAGEFPSASIAFLYIARKPASPPHLYFEVVTTIAFVDSGTSLTFQFIVTHPVRTQPR